MKNSYLALICGILLFIVLSMAWCQPRSTSPSAGTPLPTVSPQTSPAPTAAAVASPPPSATPSAAPAEIASAELRKAMEKAAPAVVQLSVFDSAGKLLRTGTGFFISDDGKLVAGRHLVEDGVNAIATTSDNKIYNVAGVLSESPELDLAVLKADVKQIAFLPVNKIATAEAGARVAVVGNPVARRNSAETKIAARRSDDKGEWLELSSPIANDANGSPVVNENGEVAGIVTLDRNKTPATNNVLSANVLQTFVAKVDPAETARWAAAPSPTKSPPVRRKIVFNPAPVFPLEARGLNLANGSGTYRIVFDATGQAKNVQVLRSTGTPVLDRAVVTALQHWKSEPGGEWSVVVPVSFQPRAN